MSDLEAIDEIDDKKYCWEWRDVDGWKPFEDSLQKILNKALCNQKSSLKFKISNIDFEANFDRMVQKNLKTSYERNICLTIETDKQFCYWQWKNRFDVWNHYAACTAIELEKNFKNYTLNKKNKTIQLNINHTSHTVDFAKMSARAALSNKSVNIKREMKECKVKIEKLEVEEPDEEVRSTRSLRKRKNMVYKDFYDENEEEPAETKKHKNEPRLKKEKEDEYKPEEVSEHSDNGEQEEEENYDDDYEEEEKPKTSSGRRSKANTKAVRTKHLKSGKPIVKKEDKDNSVKTIKFSGSIPVDEKFSECFGSDYMVYKQGSIVYDCMLNQTNLQYNNNKFYLIQLLEKVDEKSFVVWMRWGRVGKDGQTCSYKCDSDLAEAKEIFENKFYDKTCNDFGSGDFEKVHGKYDLVEKDNASEALEQIAENEDKETVKKEVPPSKLEKPVQDLIELICNISEMSNLLKEMKFDAKKAPLGKLSKKQIKAGYSALKKIEDHLNRKDFGKMFVQANNDFYTRIPHDFGMRMPPMIRTIEEMREKMKLLEVLGEIEIAVKALNQESEISNPIDRQYQQLDCNMKPVDQDDQMIQVIEEYLNKNHAPTHNNYTLKLLDVFEVDKQGEKDNFANSDNRMLLWHGSRLTNWAGILSQGLRIAPPEAPVTGYMFGKGCYFSDCSSKSANYCYTNSNKNTGILSLFEVSLGECNELKEADYEADKLPKGKLSTKGVGKSEPDKEDWVTLDDGCVVPIGELKCNIDPKKASEYSLLYNEYIVYDVSQVKLRYLVKVQFEYDD